MTLSVLLVEVSGFRVVVREEVERLVVVISSSVVSDVSVISPSLDVALTNVDSSVEKLDDSSVKVVLGGKVVVVKTSQFWSSYQLGFRS